GLEPAQHGREELLEGGQAVDGADPGRVEDEAPKPLVRTGPLDGRDPEGAELFEDRRVGPAAGRGADQDGAVDQRGPLPIARQDRRPGQPEALGHEAADTGVGEGLVAVTHAGSVPPLAYR